MKVNKIAIIGASGYIGSSLSTYFAECGFFVVAISRSFNARISHSCNISVHLVDSYTESLLFELIKDCYCVFHCAGSAHVNNQFISPPQSIDDESVESLQSVIDASISSGVPKFVFLSSVSVYGSHSVTSPFSEQALVSPRTKYAATKLVSERLIASSFSSSNIEYFIYRLPLVFSESAPGNLLSLSQFLKYSPFNLFSLLTESRSILSLDNLISAMHFSLLSSDLSPGIYNISDPSHSSVSSMAQRICDSSGFCINLPVPLLLFDILLLLTGKHELRSKLCRQFLIDSSSFSRVYSKSSP